MSGTLYVCATPIGNLEDITIRVLNTLKEVDFIAAEDTRHTLKLLNYFEIKTHLVSYHEHNKNMAGHKIISELLKGKNVAIVTDAGMPGISDPGEDLIKLCYENNVNVTVLPGATAAVTALVLSGLSSRTYCFEAFLPVDKAKRRITLEGLKNERRTIILYEAPHHLLDTLNELYETLGDREIAVVRELTKKHETVNKGKFSETIEYFTENQPKGEFVIIISGKSDEEIKKEKEEVFAEISVEEHIKMYTDKGMDKKSAIKQVAKDRGVSKRDIYKYTISE